MQLKTISSVLEYYATVEKTPWCYNVSVLETEKYLHLRPQEPGELGMG